jgi:hypothetical protein
LGKSVTWRGGDLAQQKDILQLLSSLWGSRARSCGWKIKSVTHPPSGYRSMMPSLLLTSHQDSPTTIIFEKGIPEWKKAHHKQKKKKERNPDPIHFMKYPVLSLILYFNVAFIITCALEPNREYIGKHPTQSNQKRQLQLTIQIL